MGSLSAMTVITKTKAPGLEINRKTCEKRYFLKYHLLLPRKFPSSFRQQDSAKNVRYPRASNIFIYFSSIIDTKIGYLKLGVGLFNSSYKTMYLR